MPPLRLLAVLALGLFGTPARAASADVVVYGATAGGVIAAVSAAREGRSVLLLEPGRHIGGMFTGGLGATDTGVRGGIGGYSREVFDRMRDHYVTKYGKDSPQLKECGEGFRFEPHVATLTLQKLLDESKIKIHFGERLTAVTTDKKRITSLTASSGTKYAGKVFIDASYEGDLMAAAGVKYHVGRESRAAYGESLAGVQAFSKYHQWPVAVSGKDAEGRLLPFIQATPLGKPGDGDEKVQAYNFRLCMTDRAANRVPVPKPAGYDPERFALLARYLAANPGVKMGQLMNPVRLPNGKTDTNNNGPFSSDHIGANWDYPEADAAGRARIWEDHKRYDQGFFYFLANDPRVPAALHKEVNRWGLARDEFTDTGNWPHQLYIREARRMRGAYVMTQADMMKDRTKADSIGVGSYNMDSHHVQRVLDAKGNVLNEGDFQVGTSPYAIPYRALTPKAEECENLLVPVCVSTSHVAYGTVRMEPVFMILGHAAGVAASLAVTEDTTVRKVPMETLLARLKKQKAVLSPLGLTKGAARRIDPATLPGIVVDDPAARRTGDWKESSATGPHVGAGYLHDGNSNKGTMRVRFTPRLPKAGRYEVRLFYPPASNRASNVVIVVTSNDGEKKILLDQRKSWPGVAGVKLGVFAFAAGEKGHVEIRNDGTDGHVVADAVQFILQPE
jgi:hypothetical protein